MAFSVSFTNSEGITVNLNDEVNTFTLVGVSNDLMPFFQFQEHASPLIPGSVVTAVRIQPREFVLPVMIMGDDPEDARERARSIFNILNPLLGDGQLKITRGDQTRILYCRYRDGLSSDGNGEEQFNNYVRAVLTFLAADPFFYAPNPVELVAKQVFGPQPFFPIFPLVLAKSSNNTEATLNNAGGVDAWPIIEITGPGTRFVVTNQTTGKHIEIASEVQAGEVITIDTRPRTRSVRDHTGANRFALLTAASSMFPLKKGNNFVSIEIYGGDENTRIVFSYVPTYFSS